MIKFYSIKETEFGIYLTVIFARCVVGLILHYNALICIQLKRFSKSLLQLTHDIHVMIM
jgi:hypothetical protein